MRNHMQVIGSINPEAFFPHIGQPGNPAASTSGNCTFKLMNSTKTEAERLKDLEAIRGQVGNEAVDQAIQSGASAESVAHAALLDRAAATKNSDLIAGYVNQSRQK
ncbi:hypothetical protein H1230_18780 [Paenibacillus sp. 19GGS1-52]|uniref:hypothetical protein n=1 Tax=Paenibacillus sp. 19GGS1-52 TaxID=2758563 RepID=UPI001EFB6C49|nr:hypothetical protein [Paenibacillus sp. 19GGS1-52]ULO05156.1 hypothetical protein H1230_18780 [Paenibacillus sp. 19GGS1-52]